MARIEYYLGLAFSASAKTVAQSAVLLVLAVPLGLDALSWGSLAAMGVVGLFALGAFGFSAWMATISPSFEAFHGLLIVLNLPLLFLSDALYPLDQVPDWLAIAATLNPLTHLIEAIRWLVVEQPSPLGIDVNAIAVGLFVLVGLALGARAVRGLEG